MVHILCADVSHVDNEQYARLYQAASHQRQQQADSYRLFADSVRCVAADALLRYALAERFGTEKGFTIARTELGKPYVENREDFHFSLSHSGSWVCIAYAASPVGLDVEAIGHSRNPQTMARRFFNEDEQRHLLSQTDLDTAFTEIWTAKESYIKLLGTGLTKSLTSFSTLTMEDVRFFREPLEGGYCLCLCTREDTYQMNILDIAKL